jgi:methionyl-tRNA synthetase
LPAPKLVFANGWITMEGRKMSKSIGNIVSARALIDRFGVDSTRYVLFAQATFGTDFSFSEEAMLRRHNADLANDLGNLVQRTLSMLARYRDGVVPAATKNQELSTAFDTARAAIEGALNGLDFRGALTSIWERVGALNLLVEQKKPWELSKRGDQTGLDAVLYDLCEGLRWIAAFVYPFMPAAGEAMWRALSLEGTPGAAWEKTLRWGGLPKGAKTTMPAALFPRVEEGVPTA